MNRLLKISFYSILLLQVSCYPENQEEKPEAVDLEKTREVSGGSPDETTTQGTGIFFSYDQNCTAGFGICDLDLAQPSPNNEGTEDDPRRVGNIRHKATFYLGTGDKDSLRIEFDEEIPHFSTTFNIGNSDTLRNAFGHEYIILQNGNYNATKAGTPFGFVKVPVIKGPKKSSYK